MLENKYNDQFEYLVSFPQSLGEYFQRNKSKTEITQVMNQVNSLDMDSVEQYFCPSLHKIFAGSFLHRYLIGDNTDGFADIAINETYDEFSDVCAELREFVNGTVNGNYTFATGH